MWNISRWLISLFFLHASDAANVLVIILMPSISHQIPALSLSAELLRRGHHVTYIGTNIIPELEHSRNCTFVNLSFAYKRMTKAGTSNSTINFQQKLGRWAWPDMYRNSFNLAREEIQSDAFRTILRETEAGQRAYDSIIIEGKYSLILVPLLRKTCGSIPIIAFCSLSTDYVIEKALGSIPHLSFMPMVFNGYTDRMSLWERIDNWFSTLWLWNSLQSKTFIVAKEILAENGVHKVSMDEVYRNISLFMIASNHMYFYPRMLAPNVVTVGPLHIRDKANVTLTKDVESWLDGAEAGVVYVSFGSNMKSVSLPEESLMGLVEALSQLAPDYRVLWKWESDEPLPGCAGNILTKGWFPQQKVLAHPKVRLFITQGGLQSFQEAVHYGVPLLGVPFFGDQNLNTGKMSAAGIGLKLDPDHLRNARMIQEALNQLLLDTKYAARMTKYSEISREFTERGMAHAVMMVEHITKFGGDHLRPITAEVSYPEFFCLDILCFAIPVIISLLCVLIQMIKRINAYSIAMGPHSALKRNTRNGVYPQKLKGTNKKLN
nr:PREDICTED: UDP-glucuronosyltransferase 1-9-like [Bemisia tabaci]XP_018903757.1 PREDICTED: UDP-glucuronosyltransferase 1-9-like [Bemisia tabaci]